jgi:hypothetical protein
VERYFHSTYTPSGGGASGTGIILPLFIEDSFEKVTELIITYISKS